MVERYGAESAYYFKSTFCGVEETCPSMDHTIDLGECITEDGVFCCECGIPLTISVIEDVVFVSWVKSRDSGLLKITRMPELPSDRRERFKEEYNVSDEVAQKLTSTKERADFYEELVPSKEDGRQVASFFADMLIGELQYRDMVVADVSPDQFRAVLLKHISGDLTDKQVTSVLRTALDDNKDTEQILEEQDFEKKTGDAVESIINTVIDSNTEAIEDYRSGVDDALNYLVGQVMQESDGAVEAKEARELLKEQIENKG